MCGALEDKFWKFCTDQWKDLEVDSNNVNPLAEKAATEYLAFLKS